MQSYKLFAIVLIGCAFQEQAAAFAPLPPPTAMTSTSRQGRALAGAVGSALSARTGASIRGSRRRRRCRTLVLPSEGEEEEQRRPHEDDCPSNHQCVSSDSWKPLLASSSLMVPLATTAFAAAASASDAISTGSLDPSRFVPVCPTSDGFYRILQGSTEAVVGREAFVEYGPLIAGGLLRIRLELCVVESFVNEAVIPFVRQNGLSWILPLHETVETFLAGVIFALAATFILIGSTKIITIIITYTDFLVGFPCRLLGGFSYDRALGKPVTLDVGMGPFKTRLVGPPQETMDEEADWSKLGPAGLATVLVSGGVKSVGVVLGFVRELLDGLDVFVGRYLVFWASFYILVKFVHFKVFPDFP